MSMEPNQSAVEVTVLVDRIERLALSAVQPTRVGSPAERDAVLSERYGTNVVTELKEAIERLRLLLETMGLIG